MLTAFLVLAGATLVQAGDGPRKLVAWDGIEPPTRGFSGPCSSPCGPSLLTIPAKGAPFGDTRVSQVSPVSAPLAGASLVREKENEWKPKPSGVWVGGTLSHNLGEGRIAPWVSARAGSGRLRGSGEFELSRKTETGAGYRAMAGIEYHHGRLVGAVAGLNRNGGPWVKRSAWLRAGYDDGFVRVLVSRELQTSRLLNDVWEASGSVGAGRLEVSAVGVSYRLPRDPERRHWGLALSAGLRVF